MKKLLWIIGTGIACILFSFVLAIVMIVVSIGTSIVTRTEIQTPSPDVLSPIMVVGWAVLIILSIWLYKRWKMKCHACKRWKALKLISTDTIKQEKISVLMELEHRDLGQRVTGTHEQYIPGKRKTYQDTYKCKYCGNLEACVRAEDRASI